MTIVRTIPQAGLFKRIEHLAELIMTVPDDLSDEEVEGLLMVLPPDTARTLSALLTPRLRSVGMALLKMLGKWMIDARRAKEEGRKVILVPFNFPPEVIYLFKGAVPLTSEVLTTFGVLLLEGQGERYWDYAMGLGIPDFLCSSSTIELGSILSGSDFEPDAIVQSAPGACDANSKIHEFVSWYMDIPQFIIEKPTDQKAPEKELQRKYFLRFISELEEFIGEELDEEHMRLVLERANVATDLYYELYDLSKLSPSPVPNIFTICIYGTRFAVWGKPIAIEFMQKMIDMAQEHLEKGEYRSKDEVARCLWLYVGYYFDLLGFYNWMEERGITYLHDVLSLSNPIPVDTSSKESMLNGLAETVFNYPMTRQMGSSSMSIAWIDEMSQAIKDLNADCAIYSGHHSCKQTWSIVSQVRKEIMKRTGVPVLILQGDSWMRRTTPMSVLQEEIAHFVDSVVAKKKGRTRGRKSGGAGNEPLRKSPSSQ